MLQVENISYKIAGSLALSQISFDACAGEMVVILGANGAGKSTLLKIITNSLKADSGSIRINNRLLQEWPGKELALISAVLQQQNQLQLPFTVQEVALMGRYPHFGRNASSADEAIVDIALERAGVTHLKHRNYLTLSGGEQQRVHVARVMAQIYGENGTQTRYLFMDEPSNSLDILHQHSALQLAKDFANQGNCVVAVLHDLNLALQYADKILLLKGGKLVGFGKPLDVMTDHAISDVYGLPLQIFEHPSCEHPIVMPAFNQTNNHSNKINQVCQQQP
jgi:iron complex transport system ATP-binding protein